jgi:uncharacterized protein (DUF305 family)
MLLAGMNTWLTLSAPEAAAIQASSAAVETNNAFIKEMIADHKMNIARFQNEAKKKNDPAADFANQALPTFISRAGTAQM